MELPNQKSKIQKREYLKIYIYAYSVRVTNRMCFFIRYAGAMLPRHVFLDSELSDVLLRFIFIFL